MEHLHALRKRCDTCQKAWRAARQRALRQRHLEHFRSKDRARQVKRNTAAKARYQSDEEYRRNVIAKVKARGRTPRKPGQIGALLVRDGMICAECGEFMVRPYDGQVVHVDHVTPRVAGGTDAPDNLQLLHAECNLRKSARR